MTVNKLKTKLTLSKRGAVLVNPVIKATIDKIVDWLRGETNKRIDDWLTNDEKAYFQMIEFFDSCCEKGWKDVNLSPFEFANEQSQKLAEELYESAMNYFSRERS